MSETVHSPPMRFLRAPDVIERVGLSRRTFFKLVQAGQFPDPVRPSPKTVAWLESEVEAWMKRKVEERDAR